MSKKNTSTTPAFVAKEWDASGSMHLYSYGNMLLRCFVVEVDLTEDVQGDVLQAAVDKALERLPYYRQTLVRKKGLYFDSDRYRQAFARVLEEQGIAFELLPASTYLNPLVELPAEQR